MSTASDIEAAVAQFAARERFGRLSAHLTSRFGPHAEAEDALALALTAALERWPITGVPDHPGAWLLTVAQRRLVDTARQVQTVRMAVPDLERMAEEVSETLTQDVDALPDRRLDLMLVCAHPAIDRAIQAPLMLQVVLGLTAEQIAGPFLVAPNTMGVRLSRAKTKIREAGIPFEIVDPRERAGRIAAVLDAIYACFTAGVTDSAPGLRGEAIWLGRIVCSLVPDHGEAKGLLALMLFVRAREWAAGGAWAPLSERDTARWDSAMIGEADSLLRAAARRAPGRYGIEAAIQSVHCDRRRTGKTDWAAILTLYGTLLAVAPSTGARVAHAAALLSAGRPGDSLTAIDAIDRSAVREHQPYWAVRAETLAALGQMHAADTAFEIAIGLTLDPAVRAYLKTRHTSICRSDG